MIDSPKTISTYMVYPDGRVWSSHLKRFLKGHVSNLGYLTYILVIDGVRTFFFAHRLVALLFLEKPDGCNVVNHIDGNKLNNHFSNLEWCTAYDNNKHARIHKLNDVAKSNSDRWKDANFRCRVSKNISTARISMNVARGEKNPRYRYKIMCHGKIIQRTELSALLGLSQSYTDLLIRKAAKGDVHQLISQNGIKIIDIKESQSTIENTQVGEIPLVEVSRVPA